MLIGSIERFSGHRQQILLEIEINWKYSLHGQKITIQYRHQVLDWAWGRWVLQKGSWIWGHIRGGLWGWKLESYVSYCACQV